MEWSYLTALLTLMENLWVTEGIEVCFHQLILLTAQLYPHIGALEGSAGDSFTYDSLVQRAWTLMRGLQTTNFAKSVTLAVLLPPSIDLIIARLVILVGGGNFVSIDHRHKPSLVSPSYNRRFRPLCCATIPHPHSILWKYPWKLNSRLYLILMMERGRLPGVIVPKMSVNIDVSRLYFGINRKCIIFCGFTRCSGG